MSDDRRNNKNTRTKTEDIKNLSKLTAELQFCFYFMFLHFPTHACIYWFMYFFYFKTFNAKC